MADELDAAVVLRRQVADLCATVYALDEDPDHLRQIVNRFEKSLAGHRLALDLGLRMRMALGAVLATPATAERFRPGSSGLTTDEDSPLEAMRKSRLQRTMARVV
jgi:hypothetical protein